MPDELVLHRHHIDVHFYVAPTDKKSRPGFAALSNELLLVLLCLLALVHGWLLVYVVLFITVNLGQAVYGMGVDELVVFI